MSSQLTCVVLRAVTTLSYDSSASCLAIRSSCEVCVEAIARPNTPSRLTIPTVSTAIEITTSIIERPLCVRFAPREILLLPITRWIIIAAPIDSSLHCCTAANRECGPCHPTPSRLVNSAHLPRARCRSRLHSSCSCLHSFRLPRYSATSRRDRNKEPFVLPQSLLELSNRSQSALLPFRSCQE